MDPVPPAGTVADVVRALRERLDALTAEPGLSPELALRRTFVGTYLRTTEAVGRAVDRAHFEDPAWVSAWDVTFAQFFLDAHDADRRGGTPSRPWRLAFGADPGLGVLPHLLLGMNAHINYDLPQSLLAVISDEEFADPVLVERRRRDHERIDAILAGRVAAEDAELGGPRSVVDRLLTPLNRAASRRFLREARQKVWRNTFALQQARLAGPEAYAVRLGELEVLSAAKIADLTAPGQVLLRLAVAGFGVVLPPP